MPDALLPAERPCWICVEPRKTAANAGRRRSGPNVSDGPVKDVYRMPPMPAIAPAEISDHHDSRLILIPESLAASGLPPVARIWRPTGVNSTTRQEVSQLLRLTPASTGRRSRRGHLDDRYIRHGEANALAVGGAQPPRELRLCCFQHRHRGIWRIV